MPLSANKQTDQQTTAKFYFDSPYALTTDTVPSVIYSDTAKSSSQTTNLLLLSVRKCTDSRSNPLSYKDCLPTGPPPSKFPQNANGHPPHGQALHAASNTTAHLQMARQEFDAFQEFAHWCTCCSILRNAQPNNHAKTQNCEAYSLIRAHIIQ